MTGAEALILVGLIGLLVTFIFMWATEHPAATLLAIPAIVALVFGIVGVNAQAQDEMDSLITQLNDQGVAEMFNVEDLYQKGFYVSPTGTTYVWRDNTLTIGVPQK